MVDFTAGKLPVIAAPNASKVTCKPLQTHGYKALRRQRSEVRILSGAPLNETNSLADSLATVATAVGDSLLSQHGRPLKQEEKYG
jgi:hypothetical protein